MKIFLKKDLQRLISEAYTDILVEQDDEWVGLSYRDVIAKLKALDVNPKGKWYLKLPYNHEARRKFREWYKNRKQAGTKQADTKQAAAEKPGLAVDKPAAAAAASSVYWCKKSSLNSVEKLICQTPELTKLELKNQQLYRQKFGNKKTPGLQRFVKERNACKDVACIKASYEKRIKELGGKAPTAPVAAPAAAKVPEWAKKRGSQNVAPKGCPSVWVPTRKREEVLLEKSEKEELVLYNKYPNSEPPKWREALKLNMRVRERALMEWARKYSQIKSKGVKAQEGAKKEVTIKEDTLVAMVLSSGTLDKEGLRGMRNILYKMINCTIAAYKNLPAGQTQISLTPAGGEVASPAGQAPKPKPQGPAVAPAPKPQGPPDFAKAIYSAQAGDILTLTFLQTVKEKGFTVFKSGSTYTGKVGPKKVNVKHEYIFMYGSTTNMTKEEFIQRVKKKGNPCTIVDCNRSTITRSGKRKSFIDYLSNPNFA